MLKVHNRAMKSVNFTFFFVFSYTIVYTYVLHVVILSDRAVCKGRFRAARFKNLGQG